MIYQNDGNFLEIMCVKFGGIWCYPHLTVPEKRPKYSPKSGVCLRGCIMVSFWPKKKRKTVPDRGEICASDSKIKKFQKISILFVHRRPEICIMSKIRSFCTSLWGHYSSVTTVNQPQFFESEAQISPLSGTVFRFFFGQKLTIIQPLKQTPLFGLFLGRFSGTVKWG